MFNLSEVVKSLKFLEAAAIALTAVVANFVPEYSQALISILAGIVAALKIVGIVQELAVKKWMKEEEVAKAKLVVKTKALKK